MIPEQPKIPMMPFALGPQAKNLYLVHGWEIGDAVRNSMMMDKGADAKDIGITLTITGNGKHAFVGRHLGTIYVRENEDCVGIPIPGAEDQKALEENAKKLDLGISGPPMLYVIAG